MKAWLLDSFEGLDKLRLADVPDPVPGRGEVLIETFYAALNPADRFLAEGQYPANPPLPHILGRDGIGKVIAVGESVNDGHVQWNPGDVAVLIRSEVGVNRAGTFAGKFVASADSIVRVPAGWVHEQAAGATLVYLTAMQGITQWHDLPQRAVVLITGASGGVGVASLHLCKALGYTAVALSRSEAKRKELLSMGAAHAFDPQDPQWGGKLKVALGDRRVDLAIDSIGGSLFSELIATLGMNGRISCIGRTAGPVPQFNTASLFFRRIQVRGCAASAYTAAESNAVWRQVIELLAKTGDRPQVDRVFPFEELRPAFDRLAEGPMGKVLLAAP